ncbi:hypothetical protein AX14_001854 [Amanita brunnescens Koide BX004]|nr:hypothetical protein AX14_001854 [Amanita brunnescens Koide BX004]
MNANVITWQWPTPKNSAYSGVVDAALDGEERKSHHTRTHSFTRMDHTCNDNLFLFTKLLGQILNLKSFCSLEFDFLHPCNVRRSFVPSHSFISYTFSRLLSII